MADESAHRRNQSASNAIPLQTLTSNGASERTGGLDRNEPHRRTLSDRGRDFLRVGRSSAGNRRQAPYSPIHDQDEGSPTPGSRNAARPTIAFVTTPSGQHERIPDEDDETQPLSPIADRGAFQSAIGFAGLQHVSSDHLDDDDDIDDTPPTPSRSSRATLDSLPPIQTRRSADDMVSVQLDDGPAFFSPGVADEDDTVPLTDSSRLRPSIVEVQNTPTGQRHDRQRSRAGSALSGLSVRFGASPSGQSGRSRGNSRLGDDLTDLSATPSSRGTYLSPLGESPLQRTGTMLRKMSQRVVNLSNETEPVERTTPRKSVVPPPEDLNEAALDGTAPPRSPASEKRPSIVEDSSPPLQLPPSDRNPLRGKSLGLFSQDSRVRQSLLEFLVHPFVEPVILVLIVIQTIVLAIESAPNVYLDPRPQNWDNNWSDWLILSIFIVYTIEIGIKIVVSGFLFNPTEYSTIDRSIGIREALKKKADAMFALHRKDSKKGLHEQVIEPHAPAPDSLLRTFTTHDIDEIPGGSRQAQKKRLAYRAFLRHSFNRLDFVAVVSFWISFVLGSAGIEYQHQLYVFRMMSCLRILRLLGITSGTSVILRSLKRAAPMLINIAFLIGFFWLLFSIVGVQSFKSSLRRQCTYIGPAGVGNNTQDQPPPAGNFQFCGGYLSDNGTAMPWLKSDGTPGTTEHKGVLCPQGSLCLEGTNPYNATISFDNIFQSAELVFVIMTSNTFTDIMYFLTDSDYLAAALFFAFGIIFLTFWLISLLIAVITASFQVIREESRSSAFMAEDEPAEGALSNTESADGAVKRQPPVSAIKRAYQKCYWVWIVIIVFDLVVQSLRTDTMGKFTKELLFWVELIVTFVLVFEIVFRFISDWRDFRHHRRNWFDLFLAIMTTIIQLPPIRNSGQPYAWLTVFQILRIYRVVLAVQMTRDLIMLVLRHVSGVANLILFVFLLTFLAAIFAAQLFRGQLPILDDQGNYIQVNFATIFNAFLGMYQVLSSENWTTVMYNVARFDKQYGTAWIAATFFIIWFILANFIVLNMFIAVIQENFDVSEDQKRMQQVRMFLQRKELGNNSGGTLSLSTIFKFGMVKRQDPLDFGSAATEMLLKDAVVRDFLDEQMDDDGQLKRTGTNNLLSASTLNLVKQPAGWGKWLKEKLSKHLLDREPNPFYSRLQLTKPYEELDPRALAKEVVSAAEQRKVSQREFLRRHPKYNVSLYMFSPDNPLRKFCMRIVGPGRGDRIQGVQPNPTIWYSFSAFIYAAIVGMVLLACVTTPLFQLEYFKKYPDASDKYNWFVYTDIGFAALFTVEAIIKVIADGFWFTPCAYFRSSWGFIDGVVLVTLWVNVITSLYDPSSGSRAVGAFKAFRALRLLNVSDSARDTFHSVIVLGGWKVLSAAFVSLSLLIPFAIYGLNLFAGKMAWCNDWQEYDVHNLTDCVGESVFSPIGYDMLAPRRVAPVNYAYDFDSFGDALFILFQVVSQEGWVDLMWSAQSITGVFTQPAWFASQGNAVFFVLFNLLGAVFVLTLFVSVFMRNYTEQTGVAFLTSDQRSWLELRKLLRQVAPSKRPNRQKRRLSWQEWCYRRAVTKNGRWQRSITGILIAHLILLCLEWYPEPEAWALTRMCIFFIFMLFYIANIVIRIAGLSWFRFRKSAWDMYSIVVVFGAMVTSIVVFGDLSNGVYAQTHKLFLVAVALLLIPRNNQLDQLFKTAAASFSAIANLLATWFVLFLVYAIAFTQTFGLTRFGPNESDNVNFRTVPKALILLFKMSVGESWNQHMMDFANIEPPYCTVSEHYYEGDCGSKQWAYALFVSWNIISMYIFVNLFISLIYESFSYVYQRSSGLSIISREEIRRFKQAWAEYDPNGTGFISKDVFPRFLGELSGIFEMRIYDGDFTISNLINDCRVGPRRASQLPLDGESSNPDIDLAKLNRRLAELPVGEIQRRRARMNTFYEEVLVSADPDRGIAFNALLMILAHYKVINDNKSLRLEEFLRRRARLQRVEEAVNRNIVVGFFDTLYWTRKFKRHLDAKKDARMTMIPSFGVPEILVQDEGGDDITQARKVDVPAVSVTPVDHNPNDTAEALGIGRAPPGDSSPNTAFRDRSSSIQLSPVASPTREGFNLSPRHRPTASSSSIQPDWHFAAAMEGVARPSPPGSPGLSDADASAARSRANSAVSQHDMLGMFQDSAWGQSMRRSFTTKRPDDQRRPSS
ncbi:Calcium-channel protein cch1 [Fulvia fulva]|uniref:Calcium-channel protein CCH1 n=1 Tax=Passalora fulva TaxID=5499 RepID=A0A9Q8L7C8_PASFU|nr:Calcium-channel protein cch1 [Fulvia fulva]KAK4634786.1 Calcium-channel protein cch1 [Fulvia fulva]KAK4636758.1 Calcium-channel protein cch1 [Fulvia fulva]UJO12230.1 Calcium-channel protein cch1 [Fulvia fulva]WPV09753.1 Calcium-channel protein cch1 [Fulvia fulva]WPV24669.1 Calcium-channel protein cch1 [Fulvia fulva]